MALLVLVYDKIRQSFFNLQDMDTVYKDYQDFIHNVDVKVEQLTKLHADNMKCGRGCDLCCLDFSVFPVEFYYIKEQMKQTAPELLAQGTLPASESKWCVLLKDRACSIYPLRPYICRTHGLPLVYMSETSDEMELSFCEENFTEVDDDYFEIDNVWEQDSLNSELFMINQRFLAQNPQLNLDPITLIPLRDLIANPL